MAKSPYCCPRCGYSTSRKDNITKHLYKLKKPCPGETEDIELNDEIKQHILNNRIYRRPKPIEPSPRTVINNNYTSNQMINYIAGLDIIDKLTKYIKHNNKELVDFEQKLENRYSNTVKRLDTDAWKYGFELQKDDMLDIIDEVSKLQKNGEDQKTFEDLNIFYDRETGKIRLYDGEWEEMLMNKGLKKMIMTIQSYYWDSYECYLLRKIYKSNESTYNSQVCKELLTEYYKFIGCFDVEPYVKNKADHDILNTTIDTTDNYNITDMYYPLYIRTRDNTKKSEINDTRKSVVDIIRKNSDKNVNELNKRIFELFNMDIEFKTILGIP